jgi:pimeloyl-ACP methyl ester carboxylesterase
VKLPLATMLIFSAVLPIPIRPEQDPSSSCALLAGFCPQASSNRPANEATSARSGYLTVNGIRIHYLEWGRSGPPLVLLHGLYDDANVWNSLASRLSADYYIIAPDRRGAGDSDTPNKGYDPETLSGDVVSLIRQKKLGQVTLIGHSAGAEIALRMSATHPNMIHSLIMIDGGFWLKREISTANASAPCTKSPRECALLALENSPRVYDPEVFYPRISSPALLVVARQAKPPEDVLAEYKKNGIDYFDQIRNAEQHVKEVAQKKLPHGRLAIIENASHWIQKDQPLALEQAIRNFLSRIR